MKIKREWLKTMLTESGFGLEEENQRVDENGYLSKKKHPFGDDKHFDRDFCESQLEMITGVYNCPEQVVEQMRLFRLKAKEVLAAKEEKEYLWPFSNPPYIASYEDIKVADFKGDKSEKTVYRTYLAQKYGKKMQSLCGIHFNYSFPEKLLTLLEEEGYEKDSLYLHLAERTLEYSWLIVALMSASPIEDSSYEEEGNIGRSVYGQYSSIRCSERGYWNSFLPILDYSCIDAFIESMEGYVEKGYIRQTSELYYPVRLKPRGENSLDNLREGIDHIEFRMLDVNPLYEAGVNVKDLEFITYMIAYLITLPCQHISEKEQENAIKNMKAAAHYPLEEINILRINKEGKEEECKLTNLAQEILEDMEKTIGSSSIIDFQKEKIINKSKRYSEQVIDRFGQDYVKQGLKLAKEKE